MEFRKVSACIRLVGSRAISPLYVCPITAPSLFSSFSSVLLLLRPPWQLIFVFISSLTFFELRVKSHSNKHSNCRWKQFLAGVCSSKTTTTTTRRRQFIRSYYLCHSSSSFFPMIYLPTVHSYVSVREHRLLGV